MTVTRRALCGGLLAVPLLLRTKEARSEAAADFPSRPITIIVAKSPGGVDDTTARLLAAYLQPAIGQPVIVENKAGASGIIGTNAVVRSKPDGYTLLLVNLSGQIAAGAQQPSQTYDPLKDFNPVSVVATYKNVLATTSTLPVQDLDQFVAYAKEHPGELSYGSGGVGTVNHLAIELLMRDAGLKMVHVPYKSGADAILALNSNQIQLLLTDVNTALSGKQMGNVRLLGQTGAEPSALLPDVPLLKKEMPALSGERVLGLIAPSGVPGDVISKLNVSIAKSSASADAQARANTVGIKLAPTSVQEFADIIKAETSLWAPIARQIQQYPAK